MTRDEIDAKLQQLWDDILRESGMAEDAERTGAAQRLRGCAVQLGAIRSALQGEPERGKTWQPIETAPRDATRVLVFCPSRNPPAREVFEAWWAIPYEGAPRERGWWAYDGDKTMLSHDVHGIGATHWMPLPDPPPPTTEGDSK